MWWKTKQLESQVGWEAGAEGDAVQCAGIDWDTCREAKRWENPKVMVWRLAALFPVAEHP